jgi:hypothetical protein
MPPTGKSKTTIEEKPAAKSDIAADWMSPYAPATSIGPDQDLPGIHDLVAGPDPEEREVDNLGVPVGYVSVYNGPVSQPVIPGNAVVPVTGEPIEVEQPVPEETTT